MNAMNGGFRDESIAGPMGRTMFDFDATVVRPATRMIRRAIGAAP